MVYFSGWGLKYDGGPASTVLLEVAVPVWSNAKCQEQFAQVIFDTVLCAAAYQGGKDSCRVGNAQTILDHRYPRGKFD